MTRHHIQFLKAGATFRAVPNSPQATVLDWLRLNQRLTGTKEGCAEGDCGACTVVIAREAGGRLHYEPINACIALLGQLDGAELITVEDLAPQGQLHPVQAAMATGHGSQCGFCTPGIVMSLFAHYQAADEATHRGAVLDALAGNLCRCTGYRSIVDAARAACAGARTDCFTASEAARCAALREIQDDADIFIGDAAGFFAAPGSEAALAALYQAHPDARIIAGATDVGLWITKKLMRLDKIIHVARAGLDRVENTADGLYLGAVVTLDRAAPLLGAIDPDVAEVVRRFGSAQVRALGTVGGSIANASPIGDLAPLLIALGGSVDLRRGEQRRRLPLEQYFIAYGKQDRAPGEFIRGLIVPHLPEATQFRAFKISKRFDEDITTVLGAFRLGIGDGRISTARIAYGGMAATPKRARAVEQALIGADLRDPTAWRNAAARLADDFTPLSDLRASADYRLTVARNILIKALAEIAGGSSRITRVADRREVANV